MYRAFDLEFDYISTIFFLEKLFQKLIHFQTIPPSKINKSLTGLKTIYFETLYGEFLSSKFDNVLTVSFVDQLDQNYVEKVYRQFLSSKFDNASTPFFVDQLAPKFIRFHTLFEC